MLQRFLIFFLFIFGLLQLYEFVAIQLQDGYNLMHLRAAGDKPYVLLQNFDLEVDSGQSFRIATATTPAWDSWSSVVDSRVGPVHGLAVLPAGLAGKERATLDSNWLPTEDEPPPGVSVSTIDAADHDRLLVFSDNRCSLFDPTAHPPSHLSDPLPFDWPAESAAMYNGRLYAVGAKFTAASFENTEAPKGRVRVAMYDGASWTELPAQGPPVEYGSQGFYIQAVSSPNGVRVFWRRWEREQTLGLVREGAGPLETVLFDGENFGSPAKLSAIPEGNVCAFSDAETVRLLIQTRAPREDALTYNGKMEFWSVSSDGTPRQDEVLENSQARPGLVPYVYAEYLKIGGDENILRCNSQVFEVWRRDANGNWNSAGHPSGLRPYDLETKMLVALGITLALLAFGAGAAYRRQRMLLSSKSRIDAQDLYATLGLRAGAFAVDYALILFGTQGLAAAVGSTPISLLALVRSNPLELPYMPYFFTYMMYFTLSEWLFGMTLGKFIMGLRVVMDGGAQLTFWSALVRNLSGFYERNFPFVIVTLSMVLMGPRRQRLGDILARSFVVQRGALAAFQRQRAAELATLRDELAQGAAVAEGSKKDSKPS
jgi:uncharacterized RDD family membrane protein YckC